MQLLTVLTGFNVYSVLFRIVLAALAGGLIGRDRAKHGRAAGIRTHILVCVGAAMTALTGIYSMYTFGTGDPLRIAAQVMSGIGFLGAGMILVRNRTIVTGLTTAAGLWATASIGIALGCGFYIGAAAAALLCTVVIPILGHFEVNRKTVSNLYIEVCDLSKTGEVVKRLRSLFDISVTVDVIAPKSSAANHVGITLLAKSYLISKETLAMIEQLDGVAFVVEENNS